MSDFSNLVNIKSNIERTLYEYLKKEFNDNSFGIHFEMGFWVQYNTPDLTKRIEVEDNPYLKKDQVITPMAIEVFDGDILALEGMFNAEYTIPLSFEIVWDDPVYADNVINAIEEVKNRHRGQIRRLNVTVGEESELFTATVTTGNLSPVGDVEPIRGREHVFASINFYFDISKDILYGNQVRFYLRHLGSENFNYDWELTSETEYVDFEQEIEPEATDENQIWKKPDAEIFSFSYLDKSFTVDEVIHNDSQTVNSIKNDFLTSGSWLNTGQDGRVYILYGQDGYVIAEEVYDPTPYKELIADNSGNTNYDEEVVLSSPGDLENEISNLDFSLKDEGYRYGFTYQGTLFVVYEVKEQQEQHELIFGQVINSHDALVETYISETNTEALKSLINSNFDTSEIPSGKKYGFMYNLGQNILVGTASIEEDHLYYISVKPEDTSPMEEHRIYPLAPQFNRNNTPEIIQNFNLSQASGIIQESEYDLSFGLIMKDDEVHWKIIEDIVKKNYLQDRYQIRLEFNRYDGEEMIKVFDYVDDVVILNGSLNFSIGEEMTSVITFKKYLKKDD